MAITLSSPGLWRVKMLPQSLRTNIFRLAVAALTIAMGAAIGFRFLTELWTSGPGGFSIVSRRLPYWDFTNLWAGTRIALDGHSAVLFDVDAYRSALRTMFLPQLPDHEWSYPPNILLLGAPLAAMPIFPAYLVWSIGTLACLWLAIRQLKLGALAELAILVSPSVFINLQFGQNGALTCALLVGGLYAATRRPVLAGILLGLLTIKPHLGVLVPFCLLASRNWHALLAATATTIILVGATGMAFGFEVWPLFWLHTKPLMTSILEAPFLQPYQTNVMTIFAMARMAGCSVAAAYALQGLTAVLAVGAVIWLWQPAQHIDHRERVAISALLALAATPYGYTYDSMPLAIAVVMLTSTLARPPILILAALWLYPIYAHVINRALIEISGFVPPAVALWMIGIVAIREKTKNTMDVSSNSNEAVNSASCRA